MNRGLVVCVTAREINRAQHACFLVSREVVKSHSAPFDPGAIWPRVWL